MSVRAFVSWPTSYARLFVRKRRPQHHLDLKLATLRPRSLCVWLLYLVITSQEDGLKKVSPISICITFSSLVGDQEGVCHLNNRSLLIHVTNQDHFTWKSLQDFCQSHFPLKAICTDDELFEWLEDYKICRMQCLSQQLDFLMVQGQDIYP